MEPIFKVGDKVRIKKREGDEYDYKFSFANEMAELSGTVYTIKEVRPNEDSSKRAQFDDHALYKLEEDKVNWNWASSMLELVESSEKVLSIDNISFNGKFINIQNGEFFYHSPIKEKSLAGRVTDVRNKYFITMREERNNRIFKEAGIVDANLFCSDMLGYNLIGDWPEAESLEDLLKIVKALDEKLYKKYCTNIASLEIDSGTIDTVAINKAPISSINDISKYIATADVDTLKFGESKPKIESFIPQKQYYKLNFKN